MIVRVGEWESGKVGECGRVWQSVGECVCGGGWACGSVTASGRLEGAEGETVRGEEGELGEVPVCVFDRP